MALQNDLELIQWLDHLGYEVVCASHGEEVLELYADARAAGQPFDAVIVDACCAGDDGLIAFRHILAEANTRMCPCAGVLILNEDQAEWKDRVEAYPKMALLVRPVTLKQLLTTVNDLVDWNGMSGVQSLRPGQTLVAFVKSRS